MSILRFPCGACLRAYLSLSLVGRWCRWYMSDISIFRVVGAGER